MALEGAAALVGQLRALQKLDDGRAIRSAVGNAIKVPAGRAAALIPEGVDAFRTYKGRLVAPGFAKRSIRAITVLSTDKKAARALLGVRKEAFYALEFVEKGTARMQAHPWLRPAFEQSIESMLNFIVGSLQKSVDRAVKSVARRK